MGEVFSYLLDLILPPRPAERIVRSLNLETLQSLHIDISKSQPEGLLPYHDPRVTALVWELKYHGSRRSAALAGEYMAEILLAAASEEIGVPLLIPVPMHAARLRERGHNQTELLCEAALLHLGNTFEYMPKVLVRTINTKTQQGLPRAERLKNIKNSMAVGPDGGRIVGRVCIVVDDVITTGATLEEAKRALKSAGARAVHTIALARS